MSSQKDVPQWTSIRIDLIVPIVLLLLLASLSSGQPNEGFPSNLTSNDVDIGPIKGDKTTTTAAEITTEITTDSTTTIQPSTVASSNDDDEENEVWSKYDYGRLVKVPTNSSINSSLIEFEWRVPSIVKLINQGYTFVRSPSFNLSRPGYRVQFMLILNNTYTDGSNYLGLFFRVMTSDHDHEIEWPYQLKTTLTLVNLVNHSENFVHTITPNTDPCRLRSVFLRPSQQDDWAVYPDGCGSRRVIPLTDLTSDEASQYLRNGSLIVRGLFQLNDKGTKHEVAKIDLRYNNLVTKYTWRINNFTESLEFSNLNKTTTVLQSPPFYTHQGGYLMRMFMTLLPKDRAFAISIALAQGDYDRHLQWPFPYSLEVALVDHSPEYWRKDYTMLLHPSSADCTSSPFFQPNSYLDFCFTTIQSAHLLNLSHYRFSVNGTLDLQLTTKFNHFSGRKRASLSWYQGRLVSEYTWLVPNIQYKLTRFDYLSRSLKTFTSPEFYTNGQGYLMQMSLQLNSTSRREGYLGLELSLIEGEYDEVLSWPFNQTYQLMISNQPIPDPETVINYNQTQIVTSSREEDMILTIIPSNKSSHECDRKSFVKPIERNPLCGRKRFLTFSRINRSDGPIKFGNILVKARIFL